MSKQGGDFGFLEVCGYSLGPNDSEDRRLQSDNKELLLCLADQLIPRAALSKGENWRKQ